MKQFLGLVILTAVASIPAACHADATSTFAATSTGATSTGMRGYRINRPSSGTQSTGASEVTPLGLSLEVDNSPVWEFSLRTNNTDFGFFSYALGSTPMRLKNDTGQVWMGRSVGTPGGSAHLTLDGGSSSAPLDGVKINSWGNYSGIALNQLNSASTWRTKIRFGVTSDPNSVPYEIGTDSSGLKSPDWYLLNAKTGRLPITVSDSDTDLVKINYGATITGGLTVNGAAALNSGATVASPLQHTGNALGFYGNPPVQRPTITGCRSDGTALANLLQKLQEMGLITDATTP